MYVCISVNRFCYSHLPQLWFYLAVTYKPGKEIVVELFLHLFFRFLFSPARELGVPKGVNCFDYCTKANVIITAGMSHL